MLADFERRLAEVLGARLPAPFAGRVVVAPEVPAGPGPVVQVAVGAVTPLDPDFGSIRRESAPGTADQRRVVRLRAQVGVEVTPGGGGGRAQRVAGADLLLHLLDGSDFRDGSALVEPGDPGFLLDSLRVAGGDLSVAGTEPAVAVSAEGWFWPPGEVGETGEPIVEAQVRQVVLPIVLRPAVSRLVAGAGPVPLELVVGTTGTMSVADGATIASAFGAVAVGLVGVGGGAGAGTLTGGDAGPGGRRVVAVADGRAVVTYTPPATAATDQVVVSAHVVDGGGEARVGLELARFRLRVEAPA
ncbi:MAG TPA: hypothetical protein VM942_04625 [Acidimicrobiales bacterium]|nr:hypothetical protein [Acidimicrobiales bacterium]